MKLTQCNSLGEWNLYIRHFAKANFLQSWQWGEFQQSLGKVVFRFVVLSGTQPIALAQVVREPAKRGAYFAIAGGPLLDWNNHEAVTFLFVEIKKLALRHNCFFIRFRPQVEQQLEVTHLLHSIGAVTAPMHLTADLTIEIDVTKSDEELKAEMRKQHRQALKKATELGIHVQLSKNKEDLKQFYQEQLAVAQRQGFVPFSEKFLIKQFDAFVADNQVVLFHAYYEKMLLA
nr:peptidoglycan bridge formation glycyltransferase FemA/FemB family protein [Candidatus Woesebacteria bacterium]